MLLVVDLTASAPYPAAHAQDEEDARALLAHGVLDMTISEAPPEPPRIIGPASVLRVEPGIRSVSVRAGEEVQLSVEVYGRQDIRDDALVDGAPLTWSASDGSFREADVSERNGLPDDVRVYYTAPDASGRYTVTASASDCLVRRDDESEEAAQARCNAIFDVRIVRPSRVDAEKPVPRNPEGPIPVVIPGPDGTQHGVFTPEDGGSISDEACSFSLPPGAVNDLEYIGVAVDSDQAPPSIEDFRFVSRGVQCRLSAVDADGSAVANYLLGEPGQACVPLPVEFRSRIVDTDLALIADGSVSRLLSSMVRIMGDSGDVELCGALGELPAAVAAVMPAGSEEAPGPEASPLASPTSPDAGGQRPPSSNALLMILTLGAAFVLAAFALRRPSIRTRE